jgi:hypothetical protein
MSRSLEFNDRCLMPPLHRRRDALSIKQGIRRGGCLTFSYDSQTDRMASYRGCSVADGASGISNERAVPEAWGDMTSKVDLLMVAPPGITSIWVVVVSYCLGPTLLSWLDCGARDGALYPHPSGYRNDKFGSLSWAEGSCKPTQALRQASALFERERVGRIR